MIKTLFVLCTLAAFSTGQNAIVVPGTALVPRPPPRLQCLGPNEIYLPQGVAPRCDTVCSEIGNTCNIYWFLPPSGCYCLPSYARDDNNVCVPIDQCNISCTRYMPLPLPVPVC